MESRWFSVKQLFSCPCKKNICWAIYSPGNYNSLFSSSPSPPLFITNAKANIYPGSSFKSQMCFSYSHWGYVLLENTKTLLNNNLLRLPITTQAQKITIPNQPNKQKRFIQELRRNSHGTIRERRTEWNQACLFCNAIRSQALQAFKLKHDCK